MSESSLVSVSWLRANIEAPGIALLDASWHMPATGRSAREEHRSGALPGARFFDIEAVADTTSSLPHTCPSEDQFAEAVTRLGVNNNDFVVVYDSTGLFSAPRAWWLFRLYGHQRVAVLDGGLPAWEAAGLPLQPGAEAGPSDPPFIARHNPALIASHEAVVQAVASGDSRILDARSSGRFTGEQPEPRPELSSGHMPGAENVPFNTLLGDGGHCLRPKAELAERFAAHLPETGVPVITSCGSGVTACVLALALSELGIAAQVYDGSWTEWATRCPDQILGVET